MVERLPRGIYAGLDVGSTKVSAVLIEVDGDTRVIGVGHAPCQGLRRAAIVDVEQSSVAIRRAVVEAQTSAGAVLSSVAVGISGVHVASMDSSGAVAVAGRHREIGAVDRRSAVDAARTVAIPFDQQVLHVLPEGFVVDGQRDIRDPVGMTGVRLGATVHIVTGAVHAVQNLCRTVARADLDVARVILASLASSRAVLTADEREMGVCLLDVGGGVTDLALYRRGSLRQTAVIGLGGGSVTRDLALCLRTSLAAAERLKRAHATGSEADALSVPGIAGRPATVVPREQVTAIVEARLEEIFRHARARIERRHRTGGLGAGVVLTGGAALTAGAVEVAERVLEQPVRLAAPAGYSGVGERVTGPVYSTALGLALMAADDEEPAPLAAEGRFERAAGRMKDWVSTLL